MNSERPSRRRPELLRRAQPASAGVAEPGMLLALFNYLSGVEARPGNRVVYDVERGEAAFGAVGCDRSALVWELSEYGAHGSTVAAEVSLDRSLGWLMRCDRVEFPPGGVAYRHMHPGPGIRCLLYGALTVETVGDSHTYRPFEAWFEPGPEPVYAVASPDEPTAFVRVMLLPAEWEGRRTISYVDPEDEDKPKTQRATILLERRITVP